MIEIGRRCRNQPPPPHIVFAALTDPAPGWLALRPDEVQPRLWSAQPPERLTWSSLWPKRPDALLEFSLAVDDAGCGTDLEWVLLVTEPIPEQGLIGHLRKRVNQLINADLRYSFGQ